MNKPQAHHNLPQKFYKYFKEKGINIHDPKYGSWVERTKHLSESWQFNKDWENWMNTSEGASATMLKVLEKARELAAKYGYKIYFQEAAILGLLYDKYR